MIGCVGIAVAASRPGAATPSVRNLVAFHSRRARAVMMYLLAVVQGARRRGRGGRAVRLLPSLSDPPGSRVRWGDLLRQPGPSAIVGPPRVGVSIMFSMIRCLARWSLAALKARRCRVDESVFPVFLALREIAAVRDLRSAVRDRVRSVLANSAWSGGQSAASDLAAEHIADCLSSGRLFLFIHGLDDMPGRGHVAAALRILAGTRCRLAFCARHGNAGHRGCLPSLSEFVIQPYSDAQLRRCIEKWAACGVGKERLGRLFELIANDRRFASFVSNPVLLNSALEVAEHHVLSLNEDVILRLSQQVIARHLRGSAYAGHFPSATDAGDFLARVVWQLDPGPRNVGFTYEVLRDAIEAVQSCRKTRKPPDAIIQDLIKTDLIVCHDDETLGLSDDLVRRALSARAGHLFDEEFEIRHASYACT